MLKSLDTGKNHLNRGECKKKSSSEEHKRNRGEVRTVSHFTVAGKSGKRGRNRFGSREVMETMLATKRVISHLENIPGRR